MRRGKVLLGALAVLTSALMFNSTSEAQSPTASPAPTAPATPTPDNAIMLTIFLKHDQSRPLGELNAQLEKQGFYKAFPPEGVEVVSWYVMMGAGRSSPCACRPHACARSTAFSRLRPGAPIAPSSIRPMITRRSASPITRRRNSAAGRLRPARSVSRRWPLPRSRVRLRLSAQFLCQDPQILDAAGADQPRELFRIDRR